MGRRCQETSPGVDCFRQGLRRYKRGSVGVLCPLTTNFFKDKEKVDKAYKALSRLSSPPSAFSTFRSHPYFHTQLDTFSCLQAPDYVSSHISAFAPCAC